MYYTSVQHIHSCQNQIVNSLKTMIQSHHGKPAPEAPHHIDLYQLTYLLSASDESNKNFPILETVEKLCPVDWQSSCHENYTENEAKVTVLQIRLSHHLQGHRKLFPWQERAGNEPQLVHSLH